MITTITYAGITDVEIDVDLLNSWTKGSVGYEREEAFILACTKFANEDGFGRMEQISKNIWEIVNFHRDNEKIISKLRENKKNRFKALNWPLEDNKNA